MPEILMARSLSLLAVAILTGPVPAESPATVADLVRRLGDPKFAVREAAQKELLQRGEGIVPELDRLTKAADAETAERIGKVRYALVGYKEEICRRILDIKSRRGLFDPIPGELDIPAELRYLIADHQPGSGDLLLVLATASDQKKQLWYESLHMFLQAWDLMTADQIDRFIRQFVSLRASPRPKYPAGVPAMISVEAGSVWPNPMPKGFTFRARTTRYLDGKPYDKPFDFAYSSGTVGWYRLGKLPEGKHTIRTVMEYEFTQNGQKRKGEIRSKESTLEIVAADTPDELVAPKSRETAKLVREALVLMSHPEPADVQIGPNLNIQGMAPDFSPQVTWQVDKNTRAGLHCPEWELKRTLPVDLCFDVEIRDVKTGKAYPADPIVLIGHTAGPFDPLSIVGPNRGYIVPRNAQEFAKGREGFVWVKVVLKPSRVLALSDPRVTKYFPEEIESAELKLKVIPKIQPPPVHK
jgi:hypothetical protein